MLGQMTSPKKQTAHPHERVNPLGDSGAGCFWRVEIPGCGDPSIVGD